MPRPNPASAGDAPRVAFHDAEVAHVVVDGDRLTVAFAVIGVTGREPHYVSAVDLVLTDVHEYRAESGCLGRLAEADLRIDGARRTALALPSACTGRIRLALQFANGSSLRAEATSLHLAARPGSRRLEHLHC